jgi:predicted acylesterase/phospholipase RssA
MSDPNTVRVLSLDGGGMRGYISCVFMDLFVQQWGINPNEIWKYFDVITGSSIGGIQAMAYSIGLSPSDISGFFTNDGQWIFTTSTSTPSSQPSTLTKINTIVGGPFSDPTFYPSTTPGIGTMRLKSGLTTTFGSNTLQNALTNVIVTSFEKNDANPDYAQTTNTPVYFSNSSIVPVLSGQNTLMTDVGMATSAAPLYFAPWDIGADSYIDGGVTQNNPASFGLAVAKAIKPVANRCCVLSVGTGLGDVGFPPTTTLAKVKKEIIDLNLDPKAYGEKWKLSSKQVKNLQSVANNLGALEGANLIMYLLGAMSTGPQEIAAQELNIAANYTLSNLYNYRMQYYLQPDLDTELDDSTPAILAYYKSSVTDYFNSDISNITTFIGHLNA